MRSWSWLVVRLLGLGIGAVVSVGMTGMLVTAQQGPPPRSAPSPRTGAAVLPEDLSAYECTHRDGPACDQHPAPPPANPIVGTWVRISLLRNGYSQQPPSAPMYIKFGADGYWTMMEFPAGRPKVNKPLAQQTAPELLSRFDRMEGAYGTYYLQGQVLIRHHVANLDPAGTPSTVLLTSAGSQIRDWGFEGNILTMIGTGPNRSPQARMRKLPAQPLASTALVGTWERTTLTVNGKAVTGPLLQQRILFGEDGWFHQTAVPPGRRDPAKALEVYTVQDWVDGYTGLSAVRGTYDVRGATLIRRHVADLDPNLTGSEETASFTLDKGSLTIEGADAAGAAVRATYTRLPPHDPYAPPPA